MRTALLCSIALLASAAAFAQGAPGAPPAATASPRTITLSGCVGGGNNAQPITLSNAMVVPAGEQASAPGEPSPVPGGVSSPATQPVAEAGVTGSAGATGAAGTTGAAGAAGTTPTGTAGTAGSAAGGAPTPTAAGATAGAAAAGTAGATAAISGTAPAGSSASSVTGYRLSGADMTAWIGRRVQVVGTMVPAAAGAAVAPSSAAAPVLQELRVMSVQAISGECPRQ